MEQRQYQIDCLEATRKGWEQFSKQLILSPTGSGKTRIFCWMAKEFIDAGGRALVLVDQKELVTQAVEKLNDVGLHPEIERAEHYASKHAIVVVATVQTMSGRLERWPQDHFDLVIADEADKSLATEWQSVLKHFDGKAKVAGFTATPNRLDRRNLGEYYQNVAYQISLKELIRQGYLSPITILQLPIKIDLRPVKQTNGDFDANQLHDAITPHLIEAANAIKTHASFRKVLVFVPLIATSIKFVEVCKSIGLAAEHIDGTSDDRTKKLERYKRGDFDVLVNSCLLLRGIDIPQISAIMLLRPTKSVTLVQQAYGRGTRLHEFKDDLLILDPMFDADKKLVCTPFHLIAESQEEAESMIAAASEAVAKPPGEGEQLTALDLLGMASKAQALRERALRKKLEEHQERKSKTISAADFAMKHNNLEAAEYEPTMKWEGEPVTEKQAKYLAKAGIDLETVRGKGHATKLLAIHFGSKPLELASPSAVALMCKMRHISAAIGITNPEHATQGEQRRFFAELNKRKRK